MAMTKVAVTLDTDMLVELDRLVAEKVFPNRSQAIQAAVADKLARLRRSRLARECTKLSPREEQNLAEEGMEEELTTWPAY